MIKVNISENFPITVALLDETNGELASGQTVTYDIRDSNDLPLSPPISGTLTESSVEPGIYRKLLSIPTAGTYICYAAASEFLANTEDIVVEEYDDTNLANLIKQERHYNLSVEDVKRTNAVATASQTVRNVALNKTDYVITKIKSDDASDWSNPVTSGIVYAWYNSVADRVPYKMGGPS